jgi:hypothetical protein
MFDALRSSKNRVTVADTIIMSSLLANMSSHHVVYEMIRLLSQRARNDMIKTVTSIVNETPKLYDLISIRVGMFPHIVSIPVFDESSVFFKHTIHP